MKNFQLLFGVLFVTVHVLCDIRVTPQDWENCANELGVPKDVINPSRPIDLDNPQVKCVYACLMEKARMMINGQIVIDEKRITKKDPKVMTKCANRANQKPNKCEIAGFFMKTCTGLPQTT